MNAVSSPQTLREAASRTPPTEGDSSDEEFETQLPSQNVVGEKRLKTVGEAADAVQSAIFAQLDLAAEVGAAPQVAVRGDSRTRRTFLTLLPETLQRAIFLRIASQSRSWPRIRPLFGAPPFYFLHASDAGLLRAAGFAHNRVRMAYDAATTANISQLAPQFFDALGRGYRVINTKAIASDLLPSRDYFDAAAGESIQLAVKVKKVRVAARRSLLSSDRRRELAFPRPGEVIELKSGSVLRDATGENVRLTLVVQAIRQRAAKSSTAALLARIV